MQPASLRQVALDTIRIEAQVINELADCIDEDFLACVQAIFRSKGRLVVTGIGKSAIIAQKIVATLNSTGTPALFMHAADAIHGDLGMVRPYDLVLCLSKSGTTAEIKVLAPLVNRLGNPLIAMTSRKDSFLAQRANYVLHTPVAQEADPNNLAPTASTTAQMVMGDALATALLSLRGFTPNDFAQYHPGGALGKQLYLKVQEVYVNNQKPQVRPQTDLQSTIIEMTSKCLGATAVVDQTGKLCGIITDGDLRRQLGSGRDISQLSAGDLMTTGPKTITPDTLAILALEKMREHSISQLVVADQEQQYLGIIHLHDLLREGLI